MIKQRLRYADLVRVSAVALLFPAGPLVAQVTNDARPAAGTEDPALAQAGEIIVTARKRDESLIDVPVAVSALPAETLERYNVNDLNKISSLIPNVTVVKAASGTGASMTIRGVGSTFNDFGIDQTVSVNIDGVQISRGFISNVAFFDVAQVEVLKGPQALFFGKNSPAGVISLRSQDGTSHFQGMVKVGYEFQADEAYTEGYLSGPLSDTLRGRLALRYSNMVGYLHNTSQPGPNPFEPSAPAVGGNGRTPGQDVFTGRLTLNWDPVDNVDVTLKVLGNRYRDDGISTISQTIRCGDGFTQPTTTNGAIRAVDPFGDCIADNRTQSGFLPPSIAAGYPGSNGGVLFADIDGVLGSLTINWDLGPVTLTSVSGYGYGDFKTFGAYGYDSYNRFPGVVGEKSNLYTQELRFNTDLGGGVEFAGGAYFESSERTGVIVSRALQPLIDPATGFTISNSRSHEIKNKAISVFGQIIWDITDTLELAGGARFTHETKDTVQLNTYVNPSAVGQLPAGVTLTDHFEDDNVSPEVTLTWHPAPDFTVYGAYKTGYKSGGASIPTALTTSLLTTPLQFDAEKSEGGEIGVKGIVANRRLTFSADIYSYNISGLQLVTVENLPSGIFTNVVRNAANARTRGAEAEGTYRASEQLSVNASVSYNKAEITRFPNAPCWATQTAATGCVTTVTPAGQTVRTTNRAGDPLSKAPEWTFLGGITFDAPISTAMALGLSGQVKHSSSYRTQDDGAPYARQSAFTLLDATVRLHDVDDAWELAVIGRNLTNRYYVLVSSAKPGGAPGELHGVVARPREVAVQGTLRF